MHRARVKLAVTSRRVDVCGTDLQDILTAAQQQAVTRAVVKIGKDREAVIQASGMLMLVYRITAEAAFRVLCGARKPPIRS